MPPFQWAPPPGLDDHGTLAALMLRGPDAYAQAAIEAARARASATQQSGQIWGRALGQVGSDIAAIPGQIQQQKMQQQEQQVRSQQLQLGAAQLKEVQDHQKSQATFEAALKNPENYNADGTTNDDKITAELKSKDVGAWQQWSSISAKNTENALNFRKSMLEIQNGQQTIQDKQQAAKNLQADYLGKLAYTGVQALNDKPGDPLHARDTALASVARAAADGAISEPQAKSITMQLAQAGPDQIRQVLASQVPPELKVKLDKEAAETQKALAEAKKATAEASNLAGGGQLTPEPSMVYKDAGGVERPVFTNKQGQAFIRTPDGNLLDVSSKVTRPTPASVVVNNAAAAAAAKAPAVDGHRPDPSIGNKPDLALGGLTPNSVYQSALQLLTTGSYPTQGFGQSGTSAAKRDAIQNKAGAIAAEAGMDQPTFRAFYASNKGSLDAIQKQYDAVSSFLGAADKNAGLLQKTLPSVGDIGSPIFNKPLRSFEKDVAGNTNLSQFATYLRSTQNEYARILSQPNLSGQLTDSARSEAETLIDPKATVPQMIASIQALANEGQNRIQSIGEQVGRIQQRIQAGPSAPSAAAPKTQETLEQRLKRLAGG